MSAVETRYNIEAGTPNSCNYFGGNSMLTTTEKKLQQLFTYNKDTGILTRLKGTSHVKAMSELNTVSSTGYICTQVDGKKYFGHRLAWFLHYGKFPQKNIDHINGIKTDNRIVNLREATVAENGQNMKRPKDNTSGHVGVTWHKQRSKWVVHICANMERHYIGIYVDIEDAIKARKDAEVKFGFHPNHGRIHNGTNSQILY